MIRAQSLLDFLQQAARTLESIVLEHCQLDNPLSAQCDLFLPRLKRLSVSYPNRALRTILHTIRSASPDVVFELFSTDEDLVEATKDPDFQRVFCPLNIVHAEYDELGITFSEDKHPSRPRFIANVWVSGDLSGSTGNIFFGPGSLRNEVLETLQLNELPSLPIHVTRTIDICPPSRTWEIFDASASGALSLLAGNMSDNRAVSLDTIILNKVSLEHTTPLSPRGQKRDLNLVV